MLLTPFPRPKYTTYLAVGCTVGFCIAFILIVFQPFGTASFRHPNKILVLGGYGVVTMLTVVCYYFFSIHFVSKQLADRWNILFESIDFFISMLLSMSACYLYFSWIFDQSLSLRGLMSFLSMAAGVSFLPTMAVFIYLYNQYKDLVRSSMTINPPENNERATITLSGTNQNESITTSVDSLLFVKADDNYVIINVHLGERNQRHMIRASLKSIRDQLDQEVFYQCHRSYIINTDAILDMVGNKNNAKLQLSHTSKHIPVSRQHYDHLRSVVS